MPSFCSRDNQWPGEEAKKTSKITRKRSNRVLFSCFDAEQKKIPPHLKHLQDLASSQADAGPRYPLLSTSVDLCVNKAQVLTPGCSELLKQAGLALSEELGQVAVLNSAPELPRWGLEGGRAPDARGSTETCQ